jgi:hypothetical protein
MTRSSTPRSRAAARIVSVGVVIRSPPTRFIGNGWVCRHTSSPGRRGRESALSMAAKTGCAMGAGSHQPRRRAAVRCENAAVLGSTSCQAASSSNSVRLSAAVYIPRLMRSHSRPRSHPRAGEHGPFRSVTPEACGHGPEIVRATAHLWTGLSAPSPLWKTGHLGADSLLWNPSPWCRVCADGNRSLATSTWPGYGLEVTGFSRKRSGGDQAAVTRVTSTKIGPSVSTQLISPVIRPTARRSDSTACRCASASAVP